MDKVQVVNDREAARFLGLAPQTLRTGERIEGGLNMYVWGAELSIVWRT